MKLSKLALAFSLVAATAVPSAASAAFFLDEGKILRTETGQMGKFKPYDAEGRATFETPSGSMEPKQERYKNAELMLDLAYTPVSQRGSGEPGLVPGYGDDIPFVDAMTMIMPTGWHLYRDKSIEKSAVPERIGFSGSRSWPEVLKQVGDRYALHFHIDWYDKTIVLGKGRPSLASQSRQARVMAEPQIRTVTPTSAATVVPASAEGVQGGARTFAAGNATPSGAVVASNFAPVTGSAPTNAGAVVLPTPVKPASVQASGFKVTTTTVPTNQPRLNAGDAAIASQTTAASVAPLAVSAPQPATSPVSVVAPAPVKYEPPKPITPPSPAWSVSKDDKTIRQALARWAKSAGWIFEPEHWAVPVDIPITASSPFSGDFKDATRQLIGTTELGATPLQPCFYTNRVVRVVPINEMCDRMSAR